MSEQLDWLRKRLQTAREQRKLSEADIENRLVIGSGWIKAIEDGTIVPSIEVLLSIMNIIGVDPGKFFGSMPKQDSGAAAQRYVSAEQVGKDVVVHFRYARFDAKYKIPNQKIKTFEEIVRALRDGLARLVGQPIPTDSEDDTELEAAIKTSAVARTFLLAARLWPKVSPSDIWWFVISRVYGDPLNHPAQFARLNHEQSWKRTSGWALEEILVQHYGPSLLKRGIEIAILPSDQKRQLIKNINLNSRVEADKIDVVLHGISKGRRVFFGVVHVKASFAERRTDDVPLSQSLIANGYFSPLWTMDCKGSPAEWPKNRGELGTVKGDTTDTRSAKRKDIEDEEYFSGCFSYNSATAPTPLGQKTKFRIHVCSFDNADDDEFVRAVAAAWAEFDKKRKH